MKRSFYLQILFKHAASAYGKMVKKNAVVIAFSTLTRVSVNDAK